MNDDSPRTLRDVAQRAVDRNGGAKGRELGRRAESKGLTLSYTTVSKILAGTYNSRPGPATLDALAVLADLPLDEVYRAAGVPMPRAALAAQLPPDADLLTASQRDAVLSVVRQFADLNRRLYDKDEVRNDDSSAPNTPAGGSPATVTDLSDRRPTVDTASEAEPRVARRPKKGRKKETDT